VRNLILASGLAALMIIACQQFALAAGSSNLERAVIFAVQQEAKAGDLTSGKDVCVGFGHGLALHEKTVLSSLKRGGVKAHTSGWCTQQGRGLSIAVLAPVKESAPGTFEVTVQVGDPSVKPEEHFGTLLKRGTYVIRSDGSSEPQLVSYQQTCCSKAS
jgi:hypothetical protein